MFHLHRFDDIIHKGSLDIIIELLDCHVGRVDGYCLVEGHRYTVRHDYLHITGHLGGTNWVRKNELH